MNPVVNSPSLAHPQANAAARQPSLSPFVRPSRLTRVGSVRRGAFLVMRRFIFLAMPISGLIALVFYPYWLLWFWSALVLSLLAIAVSRELGRLGDDVE